MLYLDKIIGQSSLPKVYIGIGGIVLDNTVFLNTNREMPLLGLGVYKATGENEAENAIISAVESGYRLIDTASVYKNEENVGRESPAVEYREMNFLLLQKYGIPHSVWETFRVLLKEAWTGSNWIMLICI